MVTQWKWAIGQNDVPYRAFRSIWADNRNQVPPPGNDPALYPNYSPTSNNCINPGSRNVDVFTSLVNAELVVSAPTTFTKLGAVTTRLPDLRPEHDERESLLPLYFPVGR